MQPVVFNRQPHCSAAFSKQIPRNERRNETMGDQGLPPARGGNEFPGEAICAPVRPPSILKLAVQLIGGSREGNEGSEVIGNI